MSKIIGIDFGLARIGLAISDEMGMMALPIDRLVVKGPLTKVVDALISHLHSKEPYSAFVVGLPLLMSGKESEMSLRVRDFAKLLEEKTGKKVHLIDERLTSMQAERLLKERDFNRKKRAQFIDSLSAMILLQAHLDQN